MATAPFTGSSLRLEFLSQPQLDVIRVTFTADPRQLDPENPNDALNLSNYTITGPVENMVLLASTVADDPQSIDLIFSAPLAIGIWAVNCSTNIQTVTGDSLQPPLGATLLVDKVPTAEPISGGAENDSSESVIRKHLNPALKGRAWNALIAANAVGDKVNEDNAKSAFRQMFLYSANGKYLEKRAADVGQTKSPNLGISDDLFRSLVIKITNSQLTEEVFWEALEVFYGQDATRAHSLSDLPEPYNLNDGDELDILLNEIDNVKVIFQPTDFSINGRAKAIEVAAAITRAFEFNELNAYALPFKDPETGEIKVKILSDVLGLNSSIRITGGKAQNILQFPEKLNISNSPFPTWTITAYPVLNRIRFTSTSTPSLDLSKLQEGDYVNIFGDEFNQNNQGSFEVKVVFYAYPGGILTQYFEVENLNGITETITQLNDDSIIYFRPIKNTIHDVPQRSVVASQNKAEIDIVLPATSQIVNRHKYTGAYLNLNDLIEIDSLVRSSDGEVLVGATNHGLNVGDQIIVDDFYPDINGPIIHAGNQFASPATSDASLKSIWSSLKATTQSGTYRHTSTKLEDGRVLLAGGNDGTVVRTACELFAPLGTNLFGDNSIQYKYEWQSCASLPIGREWHGAILLSDPALDGKVLLMGGWNSIATVYNTAYLYSPAPPSGAGSWLATGSMTTSRAAFGFTKLLNEKVIITGGMNSAAPTTTNTVETFNPTTATWTSVSSMSKSRCHHDQILLSDGKLLVTGGRTLTSGILNYTNTGNMGPILNDCEVYDPSFDAWSTVGKMTFNRFGHKLARLDDNRVVAIGGWGYNFTQTPLIPQLLTDCEIYDPNLGYWIPIGKLAEGREFPILENKNGTIYVSGGTSLKTEYLDKTTLTWKVSTAQLSESRKFSLGTEVFDGVLLLSGGLDGVAASQDNFLFISASEKIFSGQINGIATVDNVIDVDTFTFKSNLDDYLQKDPDSLPKIMTMKENPADIPGPYLYDPKGGFGITGITSTITQQLDQYLQYKTVLVSDATEFPDAQGYLVFNFGFENQVGPVKYLGKISNSELILDYSFKFTKTLEDGNTITLLKDKGAFVPESPETVGSFYLTDSSSGRVAAEKTLNDIAAEGIPINKTITYPGDIGIGNEGYPDKGNYKISDIVNAFGNNDLDIELNNARNDE